MRPTKRPTNIRKMKRKRNHGAVIFGVVMLVCLGGAFFFWNYHSESSPGISFTDIAEGLFNSDSSDNTSTYTSAHDFSNCYFYSQLDGPEKEIYEIYYDIALHLNDGDNIKLVKTNALKSIRDTEQIAWIYYEMLEDHPEFFLLKMDNGARIRSSVQLALGMHQFRFYIDPYSPAEMTMIRNFELAADSFMDQIDQEQPDADVELQIHDKLINLVSYDYDALATNEMTLAHTAYGAMCDDGLGNRHSVVCEGYACAFQYLLARAGICSTMVSGIAGTADRKNAGEGPHAWNLVRLDDEWYETDSCWDDLDLNRLDLKPEQVVVVENTEPQYFAARHYYYNRTTEEMKNIPTQDKYKIKIRTSNGSLSFNPCRQAYHIRKMDPSEWGYETFCYINELLPEATGTKYSLGL